MAGRGGKESAFMPKTIAFTIKDGGARLDSAVTDYALKKGLDISRSALKSRTVTITLNGKEAKFGNKTKPGDRVEFTLPETKASGVLPQDIPVEIIYHDKDIAVVNKPYGIAVHPAKGHEDGTLVNALLFRMKGKLSSIGGVERPGIVHRLDKDTAGIMIIALTDRAHRKLAEDFKNRNVRKIYHAVVKGHTDRDGRIDLPIGRSPKDRKKMAVTKFGKPAATEYRALKFLRDHTYIEVGLLTGRTHQIRVHFAHIGHAIAGDPIYSRGAKAYGLPGIALCSKKIEFSHPVTGKKMKFETDLPEGMKSMIDRLT